MDRRAFLQNSWVLGLALALGASSCSSAAYSSRQGSASLSSRRLSKAKISLDRVIKETVGLRPFRGIPAYRQRTGGDFDDCGTGVASVKFPPAPLQASAVLS